MSTTDHTIGIGFRQIARFVGYRFGEDGTIESCRPLNGRGPLKDLWHRLEGRADEHGYFNIDLKINASGKSRPRRRCRLILEAFRGPCPPGMEARHLDGDPGNDRLSNLEWSTHVENVADKIRHGTAQVGSRHGMAKLDEAKVVEIRRRAAGGEKYVRLGEDYGVTAEMVGMIVARRNWKHVPDALDPTVLATLKS